MKAKINFQKIKNILAPREEIGAIEINNRVVKAFYFSNNNELAIKASAIVPVANSTINNGYVQNETELIKTLVNLKKALNKKKKVSPYIILSLPAQNFFTSVLSIPRLSNTSNLSEAIKLNLRLRSPIPLENSYLDWETIETDTSVNSQMVFAAVGDKLNIDKYLFCLAKAGFKVIAVEKPALGVLRFIKHFSMPENYYLVTNIDRDGVDLIVCQNNNLIFYDFSNLTEVAKYDLDSNLSNNDFTIFLNKKIGQVVNFCQARQNEVLKKFFLFSVIPEIKSDLSKNLSINFGLESLSLKDSSQVKLSEEWYSVMGTAIRGTIPRNEDKIVSLMQTGTEKDYTQTQIINYISLWTKISTTVFAALIFIFYSLSTMFFQPLETSLIDNNRLISSDQKMLTDKVKILETKADTFNKDASRMLTIVDKKTNWESKITFVFDLAKKNHINILKQFISNESKTVTLQGSSPSQNQISNFKDDLEGTKNFSNITSPLESIYSDGDEYYFTIKFNL